MAAEVSVDVVVVGAGACGLTAALRAVDAGADVLVLEKTGSPFGSTSMSSGFVPAAATAFQAKQGIEDSISLFAEDIRNKAKGTAVPHLVEMATQSIGPALEWLGGRHGVEWVVLDDFLYPGHSRHRMHAVPEKTGEALLGRLVSAAETKGVPIVCDAAVDTLYTEGRTIAGVALKRPDGSRETIACNALILACNGYGGNAGLVSQYLPYMQGAPYHGHDGNTGEAVLWGQQIKAQLACLSACQGHGSLADPGAILISWALMMEGGFQVNAAGRRFSNEHRGYSEQAVDVVAQPGGRAWCIFDERIREVASGLAEFREAEAIGLIKSALSVEALASTISVSAATLEAEFAHVETCAAGQAADPFGRDFTKATALQPPFYAVRVSGALFHTQGGLVIDETARVVGEDGEAFDNLFAGGGAACGVSGTELAGYLSGNGLLTAIAFGSIAGQSAGSLVTATRPRE